MVKMNTDRNRSHPCHRKHKGCEIIHAADIEQLFLNSEDDRGIRLLRRLDHAPRHLKIYDVKIRNSVFFFHSSIQQFFQVYEHTSLLSASGIMNAPAVLPRRAGHEAPF